MRTGALIAVALALVGGCEKKKDEPKAEPKAEPEPAVKKPEEPPPPAGEVRAQPDLKATVDGKPVAMQSAFAWTRPGGVIEIMVSNQPSSCERATAQMREVLAGEEDFSAFVSKRLQPDGTFAWAIQQVSYSAMTAAGGGGPVEVTGDGAPGQPTKVKLAFEIESHPMRDEPKKKLVVDGTVDALGCPPPTYLEPARPRPAAQAASMTVAGQKLPIAGVVLEQKGDERRIVLSNGGASCDGFAHAENNDVDVTLHYKDAGDAAWQIDVNGGWIGGQRATQIFDKGTLTAAPTRAPEGAATVELTLSGSLDIGGYPTTLEGKVTAQVCPAK